MKSRTRSLIVIDILLTIAIGIIFFNFSFVPTLSFWIAYNALLFSMLMQIVPIIIISSSRTKNVVYKIFICTASFLYLLAQLCISIWGILQRNNSTIITTSSITIFLCYIIACIIYYIISDCNNKSIKALENKHFLEMLISRLEMLKTNVTDTEILSELSMCIENIKYSNISDSAYVSSIEQNVSKTFDAICNCLENGEYSNCKIKLAKLNELLTVRNELCKIHKQKML